MLRVRSLGDREQRGSPREETQRDLPRRGLMRSSITSAPDVPRYEAQEIRQRGQTGYRRPRDAVLFAPGDNAVLDCAFPQVVEHLIASGFAGARDLAELIEIVHVEIADTPGQDLAVGTKPLEGGDGVAERMRPRQCRR